MPLQDASVHKSTSDGKNGANLSGSIMEAIETALGVTADAGEYLTCVDYPITGTTVTEPNDDEIELDSLIKGLIAQNYDVSYFIKYGTLNIHIKFD